MTELEERIKLLADAYYQGQELAPDSEYDALIKVLKEKQPDSELLKHGVIGSDIKGVSKKYKLDITMGTLEKCNSDEELKDWIKKHPHDDIVAELKIDGNGQYLRFKDGKLDYIRSRGDGEYGEDSTENVKKVPNIPHNIDETFSGKIRGEVFMLRSVFDKDFSKDNKNPRNTAAGIVKRLDGKDMDKLFFIAYDVFDDNDVVDKTEVGKLEFLEKNGFSIPEYLVNPTIEELIAWKNKLNPNGEIPCDGIVIKQNKVNKDDLMRLTPMNNVAFKPNLQVGATEMIDIEWSMKGRFVSPVAILAPVELEGTTVQRASLSNLNIMRELGAEIGDTVLVEKRGLIIPKVVGVAESHHVKGATWNWKVPINCPACGSLLMENENGSLECVEESCPRKIAHRLKKFAKIFDIKYIGDSFVENIEEAGITFEDFLKMASGNDRTVFNKYSGGANGTKVYDQVKNVLGSQITAAQFLATFDAPMLDEKRFLLFGEKTLDELIRLSMDKEKLLSYKGIGEEIANVYMKFFDNNQDEIFALRQYFTFQSIYTKIKTEGEKKMSMPTICFTGACPGFTRSELTEKCQGKYDVKDSVTKDLDYLACADPNSGSSKLQKAAKNGTKIISYTELLQSL